MHIFSTQNVLTFIVSATQQGMPFLYIIILDMYIIYILKPISLHNVLPLSLINMLLFVYYLIKCFNHQNPLSLSPRLLISATAGQPREGVHITQTMMEKPNK